MARRPRSSPINISKAGAAGLIPFSLLWMAFSSVFVFVGLFGGQEKDFADWEKVPCLIEKFEITDDPKQDEAFGVDMEFRYTYRGASYIGTRSGKEEFRADDFHDLEETHSELMAKPEAECLVDPENPSEAVLPLQKSGDRLGPIIFSVVGSCFFLIGAGMFVTAIREMRRGKREATGAASLTSRARDATPVLILYPFFGIFALAGSGIMFGLIVPMWADWWAAKSWVEVPGVVIWSRLATHHGSKSTSYSPHVFYRYEFAGTTYRSDRNSFGKINGSSSKARSQLDGYEADKSIRLFVDPEHPERSILRRNLGNNAWFSLFPLPFMGAGFGGLYWLLRGRGKRPIATPVNGKTKRERSMVDTAAIPSFAPRGEAIRLAPGKSRIFKVLGALFIAAFWNGIVSQFQMELLRDWEKGSFSWFLAIFLLPFTLVGLGLVAVFLHQLGASFNPRPVLHLESGQPRLGSTLNARWEIGLGATRLKHLRIILRGEEQSTSQSGKNSTTMRSTFHEAEILSTEIVEKMRAGRATLRIPADLVPSWRSTNNRIVWSIVVEGTIAFWPDLSDTHSLEMLPA